MKRLCDAVNRAAYEALRVEMGDRFERRALLVLFAAVGQADGYAGQAHWFDYPSQINDNWFSEHPTANPKAMTVISVRHDIGLAVVLP